MHPDTEQPASIPLTVRIPKGWRWIAYTLIGVLIYQFTTLQRPGFGEFRALFQGEFSHYLKNLFGYYFLFELISVYIFLNLIKWYFPIAGMDKMQLNLRSLVVHQLKFFPIIIGAILVFGPITNAVRYLVLFYPNYEWAQYFPEYFFTGRMLVNYLLPFTIFGYVLLNGNLFLDYHTWQKQRLDNLTRPQASGLEYLKTLEARDDQGETMIFTNDVIWFEVEGKSYLAYTRGKTFEIRKTLAELEEAIDPAQFFRVNRSVIINLRHFKNYSYWENDKYILRMDDDKTTFVIQRTRLKLLRERMGV